MLKEALEDALARGGQFRQEITKDILSSQFVSELVNNPRFINAVSAVIRSKEEVARTLQKKVKDVMGVMNIPTRQQVRSYERRVARLERELDAVARKLGRKKTAVRKTKTTARKTKTRKTAARKKPSTRKTVSRKKPAPRRKTKRRASR